MFYKYKVTYWDAGDPEGSTDTGFVHAKNYGKAAMKVLDEYGEACVIDIYLMELDSLDCINEDAIAFSFKGD